MNTTNASPQSKAKRNNRSDDAVRAASGLSLVAAGMAVLMACTPSAHPTPASQRSSHSAESTPDPGGTGTGTGGDPTGGGDPDPTITPPPPTHVPRTTDHIESAVPAAAPVALSIPSLGLETTVGTMDAAQCPVLNPPTIEIAYWVECRAMPGTDSDGTTFIIGHTIPGGTGVFASLHSIAPGTDVVVETPTGALTYRVERTTHYDKYGEAQQAVDMRERVPGRLILVTCAPEADPVVEQNFVAFATLVGATT